MKENLEANCFLTEGEEQGEEAEAKAAAAAAAALDDKRDAATVGAIATPLLSGKAKIDHWHTRPCTHSVLDTCSHHASRPFCRETTEG